MSNPTTKRPPSLLELVGAVLAPPSFADATLVVVDAQREYVDGKLPLDGIAAALAEVAALLEQARAAGAPVVHILQAGKIGGAIFDPEGPFAAPVGEAAPRPGETVVRKPRPNAFAGTDLDFILRGLGRRALVLAGFMTHNCVSSTARTALDLGYRTTLVAGATASRDLVAPDGGVVPAAVVQRVELAALADRHVAVVAGASSLPRGR